MEVQDLLMPSSHEYRSAVGEISVLLSRRDPLDLGGPERGIPAGEYEAEAADVVRLFIRGDATTVDDVANLVHGVFCESFGANDAGGLSTYETFAAEVLEIMQHHAR